MSLDVITIVQGSCNLRHISQPRRWDIDDCKSCLRCILRSQDRCSHLGRTWVDCFFRWRANGGQSIRPGHEAIRNHRPSLEEGYRWRTDLLFGGKTSHQSRYPRSEERKASTEVR